MRTKIMLDGYVLFDLLVTIGQGVAHEQTT